MMVYNSVLSVTWQRSSARPAAKLKLYPIRTLVAYGSYSVQTSLTPSMPAISNCGCSKGPKPYWSNPSFSIFDIRALSTERQSARMSKIKNVGLDQYGIVQSLNGIGGERVKTQPKHYLP